LLIILFFYFFLRGRKSKKSERGRKGRRKGKRSKELVQGRRQRGLCQIPLSSSPFSPFFKRKSQISTETVPAKKDGSKVPSIAV
jgi:hypothetical protein